MYLCLISLLVFTKYSSLFPYSCPIHHCSHIHVQFIIVPIFMFNSSLFTYSCPIHHWSQIIHVQFIIVHIFMSNPSLFPYSCLIDHCSQMPFLVRSSKFRHVYGGSTRKDKCYENVRITRNAHDSHFCAVNPKFLSVVTESAGGGSFLCIPLNQVSYNFDRFPFNHQRNPLWNKLKLNQRIYKTDQLNFQSFCTEF